jgi:hypothetical protein
MRLSTADLPKKSRDTGSDEVLSVSEKYMLTLKETAIYFNIAVKKRRQIAEDNLDINVYTHIGFDDAEVELNRMEEFRKAQTEVKKKNEKPMSQKMFKVV